MIQDVRASSNYPKPGKVGGRLIREVIAFLREYKIQLPIDSHILIGTSGGSDSIGLAHLIVHYGRRIISRDRITLLHINHGWRGAESEQDEKFVKDLGHQWKVPVIVHHLKGPPQEPGSSWEEGSAKSGKSIFLEEAARLNAQVLTAHQADDLAETFLWRLFTGAAQTHGGGVAVQHDVEIRPFLKTRKKIIESYLQEEQMTFRVDPTNHSGRFLRSRMRQELMPQVESIFPKAIEHVNILLHCSAD